MHDPISARPAAVSTLHVGDVILTKPSRPAEVTRLVRGLHSERTRVYVRSIYHQKSLFSGYRFGTFPPDHLVQKKVTD